MADTATPTPAPTPAPAPAAAAAAPSAKRAKKHVDAEGVVHITVMFNNTLVTITDNASNTIS